MTTKTRKTTTTKAKAAKATKSVATKATAKAKTKTTAKAKADGGKKMSQIDAALAVLAKADEPMNCKAMVEAMAKHGLWTSPGGATPDATLYALILRDLQKGKDARFAKTDRGMFTLAGKR